MQLKAIDAHVAGTSVRLLTEGLPSPLGKTMLDKQRWAERHADDLRRTILHEPRGRKDLIGVVMTEPVHPGSHVGLLFMNGGGFPALSAHGAMAAISIALDQRLLTSDHATEIVCDTAVGTIRLRRGEQLSQAGRLMTFAGVPSFVAAPGIEAEVRARRFRADVAFSGAFLAIVDGESAGVAIDRASIPELRRVGLEILRSVSTRRRFAHPLFAHLTEIGGVVFTGPPSGDGFDLLCVTVSGDGSIDRSPDGTAMAAVMAVLSAMGLLMDSQALSVEGLIGTEMVGRIAATTTVGDTGAVVPEVTAPVWIVGESSFPVDDQDPLATGFDL